MGSVTDWPPDLITGMGAVLWTSRRRVVLGWCASKQVEWGSLCGWPPYDNNTLAAARVLPRGGRPTTRASERDTRIEWRDLTQIFQPAPRKRSDMQVLYVCNFEVDLQQEDRGGDAHNVCLELVGRWLAPSSEQAVSVQDLLTSGRRDLKTSRVDATRSATWERVGLGDHWATRLEVRDAVGEAADFITRVTVGSNDSSTTVRVSMARDLPTGALTPTPTTAAIQPAVVRRLATDPRLRVRANGQPQDGRFLQVRTPDEVDSLVRSLKAERRLPILLVHTRTQEATGNVFRAAGRLIGLVQIVTLDYHAARLLALASPGMDVPYAGGLLVWPRLGTPPVLLPSAVINSPELDALRRTLMEKVAPLSVLTGGDDISYRDARRAQLAGEAHLARERAFEAERSGNLREIVKAVSAERDRALDVAAYNEREWEAAQNAAEEYGKEVIQLQAQLEHLRAQVDALTLSLTFAETDSAPPQDPNFDNAPTDLLVADSQSLNFLCEHLEKAANGHILFTPNVASSWEKAANYPTPSDMQVGLVKLARVAAKIYSGEELVIGHLDTWVRENFDLRISLQDDDMPKKFRTFQFEGTTYDRTPHIKVNDGVPHWACGRVYFTLDSLNSRVIVDHIGLHW